LQRTAAIAALLVCSAATLRAQGLRVLPAPAAGEMIRVTAADSAAPVTGRLAFAGGDTVVVMPSGGDSAVFAVVSRDRVEVRRSRRELWSGLGALAGLSAGVLASQLQSGESGNAGVDRATTGVVGGAAAALVGGFLGFVIAPHRWQQLRATAPRVLRTVALPPPSPPQPGPVAEAAAPPSIETSVSSASPASPAEQPAPASAPAPPPGS